MGFGLIGAIGGLGEGLEAASTAFMKNEMEKDNRKALLDYQVQKQQELDRLKEEKLSTARGKVYGEMAQQKYGAALSALDGAEGQTADEDNRASAAQKLRDQIANFKPDTEKERMQAELRAGMLAGDDKHVSAASSAYQALGRDEYYGAKLDYQNATAAMNSEIKRLQEAGKNNRAEDKNAKDLAIAGAKLDAKGGGSSGTRSSSGSNGDGSNYDAAEIGERYGRYFNIKDTKNPENKEGLFDTDGALAFSEIRSRLPNNNMTPALEARVISGIIGARDSATGQDGTIDRTKYKAALGELMSKMNRSSEQVFKDDTQPAGYDSEGKFDQKGYVKALKERTGYKEATGQNSKESSSDSEEIDTLSDRLGLLDSYRLRTLEKQIKAGSPTPRTLSEYNALIEKARAANDPRQRISVK